jgi:glutathione S-transferase
MSAQLMIYGDLNSGNCLKVKWVCDALAIAYGWIDVDTMKGETRTPEFLALNDAGQVPVVKLAGGETLAQSNAIIRYLARDSRFVPRDALMQAKMDEWLFWEQYSHEPYVAVCRFMMVYLGKSADQLDSDKVRSAAMRRWRAWRAGSVKSRSSPATPSRSPMCRCWPTRALRMKAASASRTTRLSGAGSQTASACSACRPSRDQRSCVGNYPGPRIQVLVTQAAAFLTIKGISLICGGGTPPPNGRLTIWKDRR